MASPYLLPPFEQQLLSDNCEQHPKQPRSLNDSFIALLPACRRSAEDNLDAFSIVGLQGDANADSQLDFLTRCHSWIDEEVNIKRLADIQDWLWTVGRPMPPRPLHQQLLMNRNVMITERMDLHLVWTTGRIFIKPLPCFILDPLFWREYICCHERIACHPPSCDCSARRACALGFLFTYAALIMYESDFHIARERRLIPEEVRWPAWKTAIRELLSTSPLYTQIHPRFHYGELRLSRLNKIYFFWKTPMRNYMTHWNQYGSFLQDHFTWLASSTVYIAIVLTAMQVGLATEGLQNNEDFQSASYGFTLFSILGPLIVIGLVFCAFCYLFVNNWMVTRHYRQKRSDEIRTR